MSDHAGAPMVPVCRVPCSESLEDVDRAILRLAVVCRLRRPEPGVLRQVLQRWPSA